MPNNMENVMTKLQMVGGIGSGKWTEMPDDRDGTEAIDNPPAMSGSFDVVGDAKIRVTRQLYTRRKIFLTNKPGHPTVKVEFLAPFEMDTSVAMLHLLRKAAAYDAANEKHGPTFMQRFEN